ncbi:OmpA family protein [Poseidonibacter sp.]|uniref:OmpA family protein n=1 Tax=Poseidonibacter sp. TaxID=2321188 RepID=UPI003C71FC6C
MSLGKKIIFLLFMFVLLVVYSVNSFDYNKSLSESTVKNETSTISNKFELFIKTVNEIKVEILEKLKEKNNEQTPVALVQTEDVIANDEIKEETEEITQEIKTETLNIQVEEEIQVAQEIKEENSPELIEEKQEPEVDTKIIQEEINTILKDKKIIFERRSTTITKESILAVKDIAKILNKYDSLMVEVAGHTDSRGKASLNKKLSQLRANSVRKALIYYGINKDRLTAIGYGEEFPIAKDDKNGLSLINRRIEFNIVGVK